MKRKWPKPLASLFVISSLFACVLLYYSGQRVGKTIDSHRGVPVYDNGLLFFRSYGRNYSTDGYYYGQEWQCVEFVKRFYYDAKGHKMPDVMGHAKSFFDENLPDGALNPRRGLLQYQIGSTNKPCADDLLVFTDTKYGHVGIVTQVDENSLEIIQRNILGRPRQQFSLVASNGHYFVASPRQPAGWLHQ